MRTAGGRMGRSTWGLDGRGDDWRPAGACATPGVDPEDWVTTGWGKPLTAANLRALGLCRACPVRAACLSYYERLTPDLRRDVVAGGVWWDSQGNERDPKLRKDST